MILPSHELDKSLADQFASFFLNRINKIIDTFVPSGTENDVHPPFYPLKMAAYIPVSEDAVDILIGYSPTKSYL